MKLTWLTDVHLNFLEKDERIDFYHTLIETDGDGVMISGDIAEAPSIESILKEMANAIQKPIYFVLGNHDYYRVEYATGLTANKNSGKRTNTKTREKFSLKNLAEIGLP